MSLALVAWVGSVLSGLAKPPTAPAPRAHLTPPASGAPAWMGIKAGLGVRVSEVIAGSPAQLSGLMAGDVIVAVNDQAVSDRALTAQIASRRPGDRMSLTLYRAGKELTLPLVLGPWPAEGPGDQAPQADEDLVLKLEGSVDRAYLGVRAKEMSKGLAAYLGLSSAGGLMVEHVSSDEAADRAGVKAGDVLLEIEGHALDNMLEMERVMRRLSPGQQVSILLFSQGKKRTRETVLGSRKKQIISMVGGQGPGAAPAGDRLLRSALARQHEALRREAQAKKEREATLRKLLETLPAERENLEKRLHALAGQLERMKEDE